MQVPYDPSGNNVTPINPTPFQKEQIDVSPNDFGAQIGAQLEASQVIQNHLRASDADLQFTQKAEPLMAQYLSLQGRNAIDAQPALMQKLSDLRENISGNATNPMEQSIIDANMNQRLGQYSREIGNHAGSQTIKWQDDTAVATMQNIAQLGANDYASPQLVADTLQRLEAANNVRAQTNGWSAETSQAMLAEANGKYISNMIRSAADTSPNTAAGVYNTYGNKMDAAHQEQMGLYIDQRRYTGMMREYTQELHDEQTAKRDLEKQQSDNFQSHLTQMVQNPTAPIDQAQLVKEMGTGQISYEQYKQLTDVRDGRDDPSTVARLQAGIASGQTKVDDVVSGMNVGGGVSKATGLELIRGISGAAKEQDNQVARGYLKQLQTIVGLDELGNVIDFGQEQKQATMVLGAQMQAEWTKRVYVNKENPAIVAQDMAPRYEKAIPDNTKALPIPLAGEPKDVNDVGVKAAATEQMHSLGQMSDTEYQREKGLLLQYQKTFQHQQAASAAAKAVSSKSSSGNRLLTVTPNE